MHILCHGCIHAISCRNVWNSAFSGMCPRYSNGTFMNPCPPLTLPPVILDPWYTEGNGLQYTYSVPHDIPGLVSLFESPAAFVSLLQQQMVRVSGSVKH